MKRELTFEPDRVPCIDSGHLSQTRSTLVIEFVATNSFVRNGGDLFTMGKLRLTR